MYIIIQLALCCFPTKSDTRLTENVRQYGAVGAIVCKTIRYLDQLCA